MFFFFNDTATTEIYTLSLHDALPIFYSFSSELPFRIDFFGDEIDSIRAFQVDDQLSLYKLGEASIVPELCRSEEHTSELQSRQYLVCSLLLEKKKEEHLSQTHLHPKL